MCLLAYECLFLCDTFPLIVVWSGKITSPSSLRNYAVVDNKLMDGALGPFLGSFAINFRDECVLGDVAHPNFLFMTSIKLLKKAFSE